MRTTIFATAVIVLTLASTSPLALGQSKTAATLAERAKAGDADAQALSIEEYLQRNEFTEAVRLAKSSAEQKHPLGLYYLALLLEYGKGIEKDLPRSKKLFAEALPGMIKLAEAGEVTIQFKLGTMYKFGNGTEPNGTEAVKWYRRAAEQGHTYAMYYLGRTYYTGVGVEKDVMEAVKWYKMAAELGHRPSQQKLLDIVVEKARGVELADPTITDFGVYTTVLDKNVKREGTPVGSVDLMKEIRLVKQTDRIPAKAGTQFGFHYVLNGEPKDEIVLLRAVTIFPEQGLREPGLELPHYRSEYEDICVIGSTNSFKGYSFDEEWEAVPGKWTFQLWYQGGKILEKTFTVEKKD